MSISTVVVETVKANPVLAVTCAGLLLIGISVARNTRLARKRVESAMLAVESTLVPLGDGKHKAMLLRTPGGAMIRHEGGLKYASR